MTTEELSRISGFNPKTIRARLKSGLTEMEAISHRRNLATVRERGEWLAAMGWDIAGLSTGAVWSLWVEALRLLYRDFHASAIADLIGVSRTTIMRDLATAGVQARPRGGDNYSGPKFTRVWLSGKGYPSVSSIARKYGLNPSKVYRQLRKGLTIKEVIQCSSY